MRKRILIILAGLVLMLALPVAVNADTTADVTVTATGYIAGTPTGLILTILDEYTTGIQWTKGADAANTMVRGAVGRLPTSRTDGYLVYYGAASSANDTGVSFEETAAPIYYRLWSQNAGGIWEETGIWGFIEGGGMTLLALLLFGCIFSYIALRSSYDAIKYMSGFAWLFILVYWIFSPPSQITAGDTTHTAGIVVFIGLALVMGLSPLWRTKRENGVEQGGFSLRMPRIFGGQSEEDEQAERQMRARSWRDRRDIYNERMDRAMRSNRER